MVTMKEEFTVTAEWDSEAAVWVAESEDVPGLVTEAENLEALVAKLRTLIPELLEANGALPPTGDEFPFRLIARDRAHRHAA
jgi:predicted RNase H-like HicB family nuclease